MRSASRIRAVESPQCAITGGIVRSTSRLYWLLVGCSFAALLIADWRYGVGTVAVLAVLRVAA